MRVLIDIGHPSHVHYYRNFINIMQEKGHEFLVAARDKDITHTLLKIYNIPFVDKGLGSISLLGKIKIAFKWDKLLYNLSKEFKPDFYLSFASPYAAQVSKIFGKPHITFDDTDHANLNHKMYVPFTDTIFTPEKYLKDFGNKQIRLKSTAKLFYLHKNYFTPNPDIYKYLKISFDTKFVLLRFVALNAIHDKNEKGISLEVKLGLAKELSKKYKVFISSEHKLTEELRQYQINIPYEMMHDVLYYAEMIIGDSGMSSEAIALGTKSIGVWKDINGVHIDEMNNNMLIHYKYSDMSIIDKALELLSNPKIKEEARSNAQDLLSRYIDPTAFLVWFFERYPQSKLRMQSNPEEQMRFL